MGGGTRRFKKKFRKNENSSQKVGRNYEDISRYNEDFIKYYKSQKIVPEDKWTIFLDVMKSDLPTAFRITGNSKNEAQKLLNIVKSQYFTELIKGEENILSNEPKCLPWYPENLGWQMELSRKHIRRSENYFRLHNFLMSETATGNISRQETVSMIPPLLLDVESHHKVLDMCAAPGSKTAQIIELLHCGTSLPSGFLVANDIDNSRCYMLVHQAKRLNSPSIIITNHDASILPNFIVENPEDKSESILKYDRILCDVPCTGDGTLRKNPDIWLKWNAANGSNLHGVQFRIIKRGVELLKIHGRIVYSTCSLNPIENEAVIHRILKEASGSLELVDVSENIKGLIYDKGISEWFPASKDLTLYTKFDEVDEKWHTQIRPQMFPPDKENAEKYHLDRCLRILPHHQNTGGFFVAVLTKTASLPWESDKVKIEELETNAKPPPQKRRRIHGYREDPYVFFNSDEEIWKSIKTFYGIEKLEPSCLLTRCLVGKKKNIYFTSPSIKHLVDYNQKNIKIINTGVKVFARCDKNSACDFRLVNEGLNSIQEFVTLRRVPIPKEDLVKLLSSFNPTESPLIETLTEQTQSVVKDLSHGSCILDYNDEELRMTLGGWRGKQTLRAYVSHQDAIHHLRILGEDVSQYDVNKFKKEGGNEEKQTENISDINGKPEIGSKPEAADKQLDSMKVDKNVDK
ncbi:tRNA (cytosine(34)-C(5))-methyltransferase Nsun2 isoform X2 [Rhodnius prolixus]